MTAKSANEPDNQNNLSVSTIHSNHSLSVCHAAGQQSCRSVGQDSPSRCALCPNWKSECNSRSAAESPIQRNGFKSGLLGAYRRFNEVRHGTLQELDGGRLRSMRRRAVLLKHEMIAGLLTNFWEKTSLQYSFSVVACIHLGSFLDKMN